MSATRTRPATTVTPSRTRRGRTPPPTGAGRPRSGSRPTDPADPADPADAVHALLDDAFCDQ
ncbi:hypothetical protein [Streptomyces niveus]|uniref:hypothetical protein n=1 Tax=Streptomyces niveus TaxID=193462 RepID=UPI0037AE33AF